MNSPVPYKSFEEFFKRATENDPYPYQKRLAESPIPSVVNVPTGAGKTEAAVLGMWLWHRLNDGISTPRRLVYCLPRRVLVEQTKDRVQGWLENLGLGDRIGVALLMGGNSDRDLEKHPAREYVVIGTQDMLISGALNRAYGSSPYSWPITFGLLNNDCMWIMDEIQIMENALPTSVQLDAFRRSFKAFGPHHTVWMSATINREWLRTVDSPSPDPDVHCLTGQDDRHDALRIRNEAAKRLHKARIEVKKGYGRSDAVYLHSLHQKGTVTAIMVNTVQRAQELYDAFRNEKIDCKLIHSRFRVADREELNGWIENLPENEDRVVISTQVLEAGVDISVRTLITELAPWSNLVQRFGRCNRKGTLSDADIYWIDIPDEKNYLPYDPDDMTYAREKLSGMTGKSASPSNLPPYEEPRIFDAVLRRRDIVDLFDTTPDLSGNYIDASRFVRTIQRQLDVDVFWRGDDKQSRPERQETCSVSISGLREFLRDNKTYGHVWNYNDGRWEVAWAGDLFPGQTVMLDSKKGGYSRARGWDRKFRGEVETIENQKEANDSYDADLQSQSGSPVTLEDHTGHVLHEAREILKDITFIDGDIRDAVTEAARYHDIGKTHRVFQDTMKRGMNGRIDEDAVWAKSQKGNLRHSVPGFRHEAASALAYLEHTKQRDPRLRDLVAYLVASHHGRVRLSLRNTSRRRQDGAYLLGIKAGDRLPKFSSGVISVGSTDMDLSIAQIGGTGPSHPSWTERMLALRDRYGPFRLAYLELLVRAADGLASKKEKEGAYSP